MFGFSMGEMMLLAAIALIAIGPKQLPEVARTLGKFMNELKRASGDFTRSFTDVRDETTKSFNEVRSSVNDAFTAGAQNYNQTVRATPDGAQPNARTYTHQEQYHGDHGDPHQGSLFVPTDLSGADIVPSVAESHAAPTVEEEQLAFTLTSFKDDDKDSGDNSGNEGKS